MNSNSRNYYICQKLKAGPVIPPPDQYRYRWLAPDPHPEDATYSGPVPPQGACRNRYCPDGIAKHEKLVRGYCEPCASIRKRGVDRDARKAWAQRNHKPSPFGHDLWRPYR